MVMSWWKMEKCSKSLYTSYVLTTAGSSNLPQSQKKREGQPHPLPACPGMNVGGGSEHSGGPGSGMGSPPRCQASPLRLAWFNTIERINKNLFSWRHAKTVIALTFFFFFLITSVLKYQLLQRRRPLGRPWSRMPLTVWSWSEPADPVLWLVPGSRL